MKCLRSKFLSLDLQSDKRENNSGNHPDDPVQVYTTLARGPRYCSPHSLTLRPLMSAPVLFTLFNLCSLFNYHIVSLRTLSLHYMNRLHASYLLLSELVHSLFAIMHMSFFVAGFQRLGTESSC